MRLFNLQNLQVEDLTQSLQIKEKEIKRQQDTISCLMEEIKLLKDKKVSGKQTLIFYSFRIKIRAFGGHEQHSDCTESI